MSYTDQDFGQTAVTLYQECGCCGHFHLPDWTGDCRDDAHRFTADQLDTRHGPRGWTWESVEDQMKAEEGV